MTGRRVQIKGFRLKDGKLVKSTAHLDASAKLRQRGSNRVRVQRKGKP